LECFLSSDLAYSGGGMFCADTFFDDHVVVDSFEIDQQSAPVQRVAFPSGSANGFEDFGNGSEDGDVTGLANAMDKTNVERMLAGSVKASTPVFGTNGSPFRPSMRSIRCLLICVLWRYSF
jgi:hypothetical protein